MLQYSYLIKSIKSLNHKILPYLTAKQSHILPPDNSNVSSWLSPWFALGYPPDHSTDLANEFTNHMAFRNHFAFANNFLDHSSNEFPDTSWELLNYSLDFSDNSLWYLSSTVVFDDTSYSGNISEVKSGNF